MNKSAFLTFISTFGKRALLLKDVMEWWINGIQDVIWLLKPNQVCWLHNQQPFPLLCSQISNLIQVPTFSLGRSGKNPDSSWSVTAVPFSLPVSGYG